LATVASNHPPCSKCESADAAVGANNQVGGLAKEVAATAIAQEIVSDEAEVLDQLEISVDRSAAPVFEKVWPEVGWPVVRL